MKQTVLAKDAPFGLTKRGFLFLSELVAWPIADGVQARQKGAPFFPVSDHHGRHKLDLN